MRRAIKQIAPHRQRAKALELLNKMITSGDEDGAANINAALGEKEKALTELEKELLRHTMNMPVLNA